MKKKLGLGLPLTLVITMSSFVACTNGRDQATQPVIEKPQIKEANKFAGYWTEVSNTRKDDYDPENYDYAIKIDENGVVSNISLDPEEERVFATIADDGTAKYSQELFDRVAQWSDESGWLEFYKDGFGQAALESENQFKLEYKVYYSGEEKHAINRGPETETVRMRKLNEQELAEAKKAMEVFKAQDDKLMASLVGSEWIMDREEVKNLTSGKIEHTYPGYNMAKTYEATIGLQEENQEKRIYHNLRTIRFLEDGKMDINNGGLIAPYKIRRGLLKVNNTEAKDMQLIDFSNFGKVSYEEGKLSMVRNQGSINYKQGPGGEKYMVDTPKTSTKYYKPKSEDNLASQLVGTKWSLIATVSIYENGEVRNYAGKHVFEMGESKNNDGKTIIHHNLKTIEFKNGSVIILNDDEFAAQYEIFDGHLKFDNSTSETKYLLDHGELKLDGDNLTLSKTLNYIVDGKTEKSIRKSIYRASK